MRVRSFGFVVAIARFFDVARSVAAARRTTIARSVIVGVVGVGISAIGAATIGCGGGRGGDAPKKAQLEGVRRFYPIDTGMTWAFTIRDAGEPGPALLSVTKVIAFDGHLAQLAQGSERLELFVEKDGIVRVASGAYLLRFPFALGDRWLGATGATVQVTKVDATVTVEAGTFEGCVETTETFHGDAPREVKTTYCPDVGPALLEVRELSGEAGPPAAAIARLRSFGPGAKLE